MLRSFIPSNFASMRCIFQYPELVDVSQNTFSVFPPFFQKDQCFCFTSHRFSSTSTFSSTSHLAQGCCRVYSNLPCCFLYFLYPDSYQNQITEPEWLRLAGTSWGYLVQPPAQAGPPRTMFSPRRSSKDLPQPLRATCACFSHY